MLESQLVIHAIGCGGRENCQLRLVDKESDAMLRIFNMWMFN